MKFSKTTGCFYPEDISYPSLPNDLIDVSKDDYEASMVRQPGETLDVVNDRVVVIPAATPTAAELLAETAGAMTVAVQIYMDGKAQAGGYDNLLSAISYSEEPAVPSFQAEGLAFRAWRSHVWATCHELLAQVQAGTMAVPTKAELLAMLPPAPLIRPV